MRKAIIAAIVASALFAVGAFAASFAVESEDVASGTDDVQKCADLVDVAFTTAYDANTSNWNAVDAVVTFYRYVPNSTTDFTASTECAVGGYDVTLALDYEAGGLLGTYTEPTWANGVATFAGINVPVGSIGNAAVLTDGVTLFADSANNTANQTVN